MKGKGYDAFAVSLVNTGFNQSDCWAPLGNRGPVLLTGRKGIRDRLTETVRVCPQAGLCFPDQTQAGHPILHGGPPGLCV